MIVTRTEYLEIDGLALSTPAWEVLDPAAIFDVPDLRFDPQRIPYRRGALEPGFVTTAPRRVDLPMLIRGDQDPDGVPYLNPREGVAANRDRLATVLASGLSGVRTLRFHRDDGRTLSGPVIGIGGMRPQSDGPSVMRASVGLLLIEGGLRNESTVLVTSAEAPAGGSVDLAVQNPGTMWQDQAVLTLTGTATTVTVTNLTDGPTLTFGGNLTGGVVIDTGAWTAVRGGSVDVVGLVTHSGHPRWMPIRVGNTTLRVAPTGGTATLQVVHYPFYA